MFVGYPLSLGVRATVVTLGWLACANGIFGNVLIISTLLSQQALRSVHNIYIANLALADLLVMGYVVPFWLLDLSLGYQPVVNMAHCEFNASVLSMCIIASIYTLVLIGFNRYLSVCYSSVYKKLFSKRSTIATCVLIWIASSFMSSFAFMGVGKAIFLYNLKTHLCTFDASDPTSVYSILTSFNLLVPTWLIGFFSLSIYKFWKRSRNRVGQWNRPANNPAIPNNQDLVEDPNPGARQGPRLSSSDVALVRSLVLVFVLLLVLYIPISVALSLDSFKVTVVSSDSYAFCVLLLFLNHSINWIVYGLMNKNFMEGYRRQMASVCVRAYACVRACVPAN
nr:hypothetical protein BaRGS_024351 [Batillaria attramentaria]